MMLVFMVLAVILSVALIVLVTIQPRQTQIFSTDATSNIGKPSYWASQPIRKMLTTMVSRMNMPIFSSLRAAKRLAFISIQWRT